MDIFNAGGHSSGKAYYVFYPKSKSAKETLSYIETVSRERKIKRSQLEAISVYIKGKDLYLTQVPNSKKAVAIVRRSSK